MSERPEWLIELHEFCQTFEDRPWQELPPGFRQADGTVTKRTWHVIADGGFTQRFAERARHVMRAMDLDSVGPRGKPSDPNNPIHVAYEALREIAAWIESHDPKSVSAFPTPPEDHWAKFWAAIEFATERETPARNRRSKAKATNKPASGSRHWTQADVDDAIRKYRAKRAGRYGEIAEGVRQGLPGAKKAARELFGRNNLARALECPPAMISKSSAWEPIKAQLRLFSPKEMRGSSRPKKIGLDIAMEEATLKEHQRRLKDEQRDELQNRLQGKNPKALKAAADRLLDK
ncbi:MAG: hypothetical protein ABII12_02580 [Planctomycetota bacterium]